MDDKTFYIDHFSVYIIVFLFEKKREKIKNLGKIQEEKKLLQVPY